SVIFVIRCLLALWFGGRIVALSGLASEETFDLLADYLLIDGLLGIALGVSYLRQAHARGARREWTLGVIFAADAVGRSLAGTAIHLWPGIAGFPVTAVVFIGIMAACTAAVGFGELVVAGEEE